MNFTRTTRRTLTLWAMLPLALWSGLPATICRCETGEYRIFCRHALSGQLPVGAETTAAVTPQRSCCARRTVSSAMSSSRTSQRAAGVQRSDCCGHCQLIALGPSLSESNPISDESKSADSTAVAGVASSIKSSSQLSAAVAFDLERQHKNAVDWVVVLHCFRV